MKKQVYRTCLIVTLICSCGLAAMVRAQGLPGWMAEYSGQLGVVFTEVTLADGTEKHDLAENWVGPGPNQAFSELQGIVRAPEKLAQFGLKGIPADVLVKVRPTGIVSWSVTRDDQQVRPCIFTIEAPSRRAVKLMPEDESLKLKVVSPPPYRSSMQKDPGN